MKPLHDYLNREKPCALYIAGFGSGPNTSKTYKHIKNFLKDWEVYCPNLDLTESPMTTMETIDRLASEYDLVIGSSLGAFYVLSIENSVDRIVINPCMHPTIEMPKLTNLSDTVLKEFKRIEKKLNEPESENKILTYGIFGDNDELFSYKDEFKKKYRFLKVVPGGHRLEKESLIKGLEAALKYFDKVNKQLGESFIDEDFINEHFVNVFIKDSSSRADLLKYKDAVWDMLSKSYEKIGGLAGCPDVESLIEDTDFWKICTKNSRPVAVCVYSFKRGGRKLVFAASSGDEEGKQWLYKILDDDIKFKDRTAWAEVSGAMEHIMVNKKGAVPIPADIAQQIMKDKKFLKIHDDGVHYDRLIGGNVHTKIMVGFPKLQ